MLQVKNLTIIHKKDLRGCKKTAKQQDGEFLIWAHRLAFSIKCQLLQKFS